MSEPKQIAGTPAERDMVRPFGLSYMPEDRSPYEVSIVKLTVPDIATQDGTVRFARAEYSLDQFYELRESINDLYDHIRQETPTD